MFQLTVPEHINLSLESMLAAYEGHKLAASRLGRHWWYARLLTLGFAAATVVLNALALQRGPAFLIAATAVSTAALSACAAYVAFDPSPRIYGHRASAARLWLLCENYRMLLAEMHDGLIDVAGIRERRNELARQAAAALEQAPPADRYSYEIARKSIRASTVSTPAA